MKKSAILLNNHLASNKYLTGNKVTIADISVYGDLGQFSKSHLDLYNFEEYPNLNGWLGRMKELPKYDEAHGVLSQLKKLFEKAKL